MHNQRRTLRSFTPKITKIKQIIFLLKKEKKHNKRGGRGVRHHHMKASIYINFGRISDQLKWPNWQVFDWSR
jgi:hypothetical protein